LRQAGTSTVLRPSPAARGSGACLVAGGSGATRGPCGTARTAPSLIAGSYGSAPLAQCPCEAPQPPAGPGCRSRRERRV